MQKNVAGQIWTVYAYSRTSGNPITGDAANISATLCLDGVAEAPCGDAHPDEKGHGYYQFLPSQAETDAVHIEIHPVSATANVIVIGCPGALWTEPAGQKYPASLAAADVSGNLPAAVNEQANIDFGALQKQSLNAATPASIQNIPATGSGFTALGDTWLANLDASVSSRSTFAGGAVESVTDPVSLAVTPPTAAQVRAEMDDHSTQLAAIASAVAPDGSSTYTDTIEDPDGDPIDGVSVECYSDSDYTTLVQVTETDANGVFIFHLNPATYYFRAIKVGYTFTDWSEVIT